MQDDHEREIKKQQLSENVQTSEGTQSEEQKRDEYSNERYHNTTGELSALRKAQPTTARIRHESDAVLSMTTPGVLFLNLNSKLITFQFLYNYV